MSPKNSSAFSDFVRGKARRGKQTIAVPGRLEFVISAVDVSLVNGLRRAILMDVPTVAIRFDATDPEAQDVRVIHNTCNLHNELIGDRVGLISFHLSKKQLLDYKPASWRFELDVSNTGTRPLDVTTADLGVVPISEESEVLNPANLFRSSQVSGRHPILTVLMPPKHGITQRLVLEGISSFGTGAQHARFSPVSVCAFTPLLDETKVKRERERRDDKATFDALDARRIIRKDGKGNPEAFEFFLETECGMTPEEIVESGLEALAARMRSLADDAEGPRVSEIESQTDAPADMRSLKLEGETDTAGALVQAELLGDNITDFAGYYVPHHLERSIVLVMRVKDGKSPRAMLRAACESAATKAENLVSQFQKAAF
jgi:DNA-directed RNA polymerase subunit L